MCGPIWYFWIWELTPEFEGMLLLKVFKIMCWWNHGIANRVYSHLFWWSGGVNIKRLVVGLMILHLYFWFLLAYWLRGSGLGSFSPFFLLFFMGKKVVQISTFFYVYFHGRINGLWIKILCYFRIFSNFLWVSKNC